MMFSPRSEHQDVGGRRSVLITDRYLADPADDHETSRSAIVSRASRAGEPLVVGGN